MFHATTASSTVVALLLLVGVATSAALPSPPAAGGEAADNSGGGGGFLRKSEVPDTGGEWISLDKDTEFQPAPDSAGISSDKNEPAKQQQQQQQLRMARQRFLFGSTSNYGDKFVDGNTYYDEYSQAWRCLGWYVDCNPSSEERRTRRLEDGYDDEEEDDGNNDNANGCTRYILWAAYVDLDYQGGGIGEYQFYDAKTGEWDMTACEVHGNERCAKMDCHLPSTHFKLLGFFKQYDYDDFLEQLFKHQAYCLWSEDQYEFMDGYRDWWPEGCTQTDSTDGNDYIYTDIQPMAGGKITLGLYTDAYCTVPYKGNAVRRQDIAEDYYGSSVNEHIAMWNEAFGIFNQCQPCKAYTLSTSVDNEDNNDDEDDPNEGYFGCDDDAGYENVNQCMKFRSKTDMELASYPDLSLASRQGTITKTYAADVEPTLWDAWGFLTLASVVFVIGLVAFIWSARPPRVIKSRGSTEPLVPKK